MTEHHIEELIKKYAQGIASEEEVQQLMKWYDSAVIEDVAWPATGIEDKHLLHGRLLKRLKSEIVPNKRKLIRLSWIKVAALIILVFGGTLIAIQFSNSNNTNYTEVNNPSGKIQQVLLPDGSSVWLNAESKLRYLRPFISNRNIELEGEAFFDVTRDTKHPFTIKTGALQTSVLGTSFVVKAYKNDSSITVSVLSGKVKVATPLKTPELLTHTMQLKFDRHTQEVKMHTIDTTAVAAWKKGKLAFYGQPLSEIAATLERWYGVSIHFSNPKMKACRYYMSFNNNMSLEELLSTMAEVTQMQYNIDKTKINTVILSGAACQ